MPQTEKHCDTTHSQTISHPPLIKSIPRQRQEVAIRRILPITLSSHSHRSHSVQVKVLELVSELHLSISRVRDLHEQLLRPRLVLRRVLLLLTRERPLVVLYHPTPSPRLPSFVLFSSTVFQSGPSGRRIASVTLLHRRRDSNGPSYGTSSTFFGSTVSFVTSRNSVSYARSPRHHCTGCLLASVKKN